MLMSENARRILAVVLGALLVAGSGFFAPASADVLISAPQSRVCVGKTIKVGVWYQSYSGGPRRYRIKVYGPNGGVVFSKSGRARSDRWTYWRVPARRLGTYQTVYRSGANVADPWVSRSNTRSVRC